MTLRKTLEHEIYVVSKDIFDLGGMVEGALIASVTALKNHDMEQALTVREEDKRINAKRYDLEGQIIVTIATQSPAARDLRFLASCMTICTELERIGDYAKAIANANLISGGINAPSLLTTAHRMGLQTADMLRRSMFAFIEANTEAARNIILEDDIVDEMYERLYQVCLEKVSHDPRMTDHINYLIWAAHNLERAADRATNICERAIYVETGSFDHADPIS